MFARSKRFDSLIQNRVKRVRAIGTSQNTRKLFSQFRIFQSSTKRILNNLLCFRLLDFNLTLTESIFRIGKSLLVISVGRKVRLPNTFSLGLSIRKTSLSLDSTFISIGHVLGDKTIGIGLRSLGGLLSGTLVEFLNTRSLLINIRNGINFGVLGSDLIHSSAEAARKKFIILDTLDNIKNFIGFVDTDSLGLNFQTVSVR